MSQVISSEFFPPSEMTESYGEKDQTTDPLARSHPRGERQAAVMRFLEEKLLTEREVEDRSSAVLSCFISSMEDREWRSVQDRMMEPVSQTNLAQMSKSIIRMVSQLVLRLLPLALNVQLQPEDESTELASESDSSRPSAVVGDQLHKHFEMNEETLAQLLGSSASQPAVRSMLGNVVKQLNLGLYVLAAQSQDSTETKGSEVTSAAMKVLWLAGEALADVTHEAAAQDADAFLETATEEVVSTIADSMTSCQERDRKSGRILRDLAAKISKQRSEAAELQSCLQQRSSHAVTVDVTELEMLSLKSDSDDQPEPSASLYSQSDIQPYPLLVSSEKVSSDLSESHGSCLQVLNGLLSKLLALFSPRSFSLMTGPQRSSLPTLESVSSDILDVVENAVKEMCQKKKSKFLQRRQKKTRVSEEQVDATATEIKVALREKLREFLTCHKEAAEEVKNDELEQVKRTVSTLLSNLRDKTAECEDAQEVQSPRVQTVRNLLDQIEVCSDDSDSSTLIRLEDLINEDNLSSFAQLLMRPVSPPSSGPISPSEQVNLLSEAAVKHLLTSLLLPPSSWGMGQVIRVQSSQTSASRFAESAELYNDFISLYAQVMCDQVMISLSRSSAAFRLQLELESFLDVLEKDNGAPKKKKRKNIVHFFQKLPKKISNKWKKLTNRLNMYSSPSVDGEDETTAMTEDHGVDISELRKRRVVHFFQTLPEKIVRSFWLEELRPWQGVALFPLM